MKKEENLVMTVWKILRKKQKNLSLWKKGVMLKITRERKMQRAEVHNLAAIMLIQRLLRRQLVV
jgi:hypothetical protein